MSAKDIIANMESLYDEDQRRVLMGFFKTRHGEYGEGDEFLGLKVPQTREIVKKVWKEFPLSEVPELLINPWHEVRLCGLLILVAKYEKLATKRMANDEAAIHERNEILAMYLEYAEQANNWDLVDLSAPKILGTWLLTTQDEGTSEQDIKHKRQVLDELAQSDNLWKQRMSIVCTWKTSHMGDPSWCLRYAEIHLHHPHDLMHKAVGWILREMGKRCSIDLLRDFLRQHAHEMPRTMLRYAIEKMSEEERKNWMRVPQDFAPARNSKANRFAGIPIPDFVDMIIMGDDEAMYYLLHDRLSYQLRNRFETYKNSLYDVYEDVIDDFFLYLRERGSYPYQTLQRIKKQEAFESWLLNTFRNYLNNRAETEGGIVSSRLQGNYELRSQVVLEMDISDEDKIRVVSQLIAYAHQVFYPRGRFILLRSLLSMLNKQRAVPNKEMAEALDMSYLAYRVTLHHMRQNVRLFRERLLKGESLCLDADHQLMADSINRDFTHLYPTLFRIYIECIDTLKTSTAVKNLRQQYLEECGFAVHEPDTDNSISVRISYFWRKLNSWIIT